MPINENAPLNVVPGAIRFNTDSMKLEYYRGGPVGFGTTTTTGEWVQVVTENYESVGIGITFAAGSSTGSGTRGVFAGGYSPTATNAITYINISSTGNSVRFGDLIEKKNIYNQSVSSSTRGVWGGGYGPALSPSPEASRTNTIEFITISSTGNAADFGDLTRKGSHIGACSNSTRGLFGGGVLNTPASNTNQNVIDYITIASTGNAQDFGDLNDPTRIAAPFASSTRGIWSGGENNSQGRANAITFITISTLGNSTDFGDINNNVAQPSACSNSIRGLVSGGQNPAGTNLNNIDYITIATLGNAIDFGDLTAAKISHGGCASPTRGVFAGGQAPPTTFNVIEYVTIMSTGNAIDFGDLIVNAITNPGSCSNGHGGLG